MKVWIGAQISLAIAAVLVVGGDWTRRTIAGAVLVLSASLPWFAPGVPLVRALLCFVGLLALVKTTQIAATPGPWPAWRRVWHGLVPFDVRQVRLVKPALDWPILGMVLLYGAIGAGAFVTLSASHTLPGSARLIGRFFSGALLVFAWIGGSSEIVRLAHRVLGVAVPPIQRAPLLARSAGEFWGERWNRPWSDWLRHFAFLPLARQRHGALGLFAAFAVSGVMHAWLGLVALDVPAAAMMGAFFLLQGLIVLVEARLCLRAWPRAAAHLWTLFVLLAPSPLFVAPFLRALNI
ncbi:MAG: MBOAT family protein [Acidobacteriota bacterium]